MNHFKDVFESIPEYRKIILIFSIQNDKNAIRDIGFNEHDIKRLNLEFRKILIEQHEEYLAHLKNEEKSVIERFFEQVTGKLYLLVKDINHLCIELKI